MEMRSVPAGLDRWLNMQVHIEADFSLGDR